MNDLRKNDIFTVNIEGYTSDGSGVSHIDGRAVFIPGTVAGEIWEVKLLKVTAGAVYAKALNCISSSPERLEAQCPYFGKCGGCDTWHMSYDEELKFKLQKVNDCLLRIGRQSVSAESIIPSDSVTRYRNKGIFAVGKADGAAVCGFYRERSHDIIPIESCLIQNELSDRVSHAVTEFMISRGIESYDESTGKGTVRHVFCRKACHTTDAVVCIVAARGLGTATAALVSFLREKCPELTGIVLNINKGRGNTVLSGDFYTLWGSEIINDTLCGLKYAIAPQAFFQINPPQAEKLYAKALEYAAVGKDDLVFDLYCGAGTISLCLAREAGHVIGAEIVPEAIENANKNALANGIKNAEFICADAGKAAEELKRRELKPAVIVVDPPRKGMSDEAVSATASIGAERIVYVSCDPATLSRDILRFNSLGYTLISATAVDMFPRTSHVETVVLLSRV